MRQESLYRILLLSLGLADLVQLIVDLQQFFLGEVDIGHTHQGGQAQNGEAAQHLAHTLDGLQIDAEAALLFAVFVGFLTLVHAR